ncbi:MAG TPA: hypothetical protein VHX43_16355 [Xanthobacteraceae bacterium]|jgi:hypothetical protein|nr:hypothetical protein [Xanthobacteraceae bacterium]
MRRIGLSVGLALALSGLAFSGSASAAWPACAVGTSVNNHARIMLNHKMIASCSGASGCKCVSCYNLDGSVYSACYALFAPMPK